MKNTDSSSVSLKNNVNRVGEFDCYFYAIRYSELPKFDCIGLYRHYIEHGLSEGRFGNAGKLIAALSAERGALPTDFDAKIYRSLNDDLASFTEDWQLTAHYLEFGRDEGRPYRPPAPLDADRFDPSFYRKYYKDLGGLDADSQLRDHFETEGRHEGRHGTPAVLIAALESERGALPRDFSPSVYRSCHKDLAFHVEAWESAVHYLEFGRDEGRPYRYDIAELEAAYEARGGSDREPGSGEADRFDTLARFLDHHGVMAGPWLDLFNLSEFCLLNADRIPELPLTLLEGIVLFVERGIDALWPIALECAFDPDFYRAIVPGEAAAGAPWLYREWLNHGCGRGEAPNETVFLRNLIGTMPFPACFDEAAYREALPATIRQPGPGRALALEHFFRTGFPLDLMQAVSGSDAGLLYERVGTFHLTQGNAGTAKRAYDLALAGGLDSSSVHHMLGDALRALGREREAAEAYAIAAARPRAGLWSHIHAAEGLAKLGRTEAALDVLARSAAAHCGSAPWRAAGHRVLEYVFEHEGKQIRALYRSDQREEADAALTALLMRLTDAVALVDPPPTPLPPRDGPVVILANRDLPQCDHYRVTQKLQQLEHGGWAVELHNHFQVADFRAALDRASAAIFYRVAATPAVIHAMVYARSLGLLTVYDIDDIIFDAACYPDPFDSFEGQIKPEEYESLLFGVPLFRHAMSLCEVGLASTPALADAMRPIVRSGTCHVLRNGLDDRNAPYLAREPRPFSGMTLTIFYGSGTKAHNKDFTDLAAPALLRALARYPHVRLVIAGHLHFDERFAPFAGRIRKLGFTGDVDAYWETLSGADINLAVLKPGVTTDAKSEIKWIEAAVCGIPSIVSATRTYREILIDGEDALLADTPEAWCDALDRLIGNPDLRRRIGARAREKVAARYGLSDAAEALRALLPAPENGRLGPGAAQTTRSRPIVMAGEPAIPARDAAAKPRLLVVNVFFPPQTIGGATRVVRDNVDHLIDRAADAFDLLIVATDHGAEPAYRTRVDSYRGVPVVRIASPIEAGMDWRPFDARMEVAFEEIVDRFGPDLVHFHCVQRLTASVVEVVRDRGVPYLVTLHDAWWISDFQFLVDEDGEVQIPTADVVDDRQARAVGAAASIARRRRLATLLEGATCILAVSETFANLYRDAGHGRTIAVPNGVSPIRAATRQAGTTGRVRLGHIGGRSVHKGATLIEIVLQTTPFRNLALTLVDHAYGSDQVSEEVWGTTPVRIVGPVPQEEIAELYARLDVLLAPSLWPESFGLVAREARAAGLWVVASDRGAIGEDVTEGVDGFRIDVATGEGLRSVLAHMDADPGRFRAAPLVSARPVRTAEEQGAELVELYEISLSKTLTERTD